MHLVTFCRLVACALIGAALALPAAAAPKIGLLLKGKTAFWASMEKGALEAGQKLGIEIIVKTPVSENDIAVQVQLLAALAGQGIDALVIAPSSKDALAAPIAALAAKGIKIVVVDSSLGPGSPGVFVGTDQHAAGEEAGKLLGSLVADGDEISILKNNQTSVASTQREQGATEKLHAAHPNAIIHGDIYSGTDEGVEAERAALLLSKYPATRGIIASGSGGTLAMIKVLKGKKTKGPINFVGFGYNLTDEAAAAIENGTMQGWVAQLPHAVGAQGIEAAAALIKGEKVPATTYSPIVIVTKRNLKEPAIQALLSR